MAAGQTNRSLLATNYLGLIGLCFRQSLTGEVVATNVVDIGVLNEAPDLGLLQVVNIVVVGGTKVGAETAVVTGDNNTATAGLNGGVDTVFDTETSSLDSIAENGRVLVLAGTAEVDDAVLGEDVLGTTGTVLGGTTSNQLSFVVVEEILVEGKVLLLSENSIVGLEAVLVEKLLVADSLDVCEIISTEFWAPRQLGLRLGPPAN